MSVEEIFNIRKFVVDFVSNDAESDHICITVILRRPSADFQELHELLVVEPLIFRSFFFCRKFFGDFIKTFEEVLVLIGGDC